MNATLAEIDDALNRARETRDHYAAEGCTAGVTVANTAVRVGFAQAGRADGGGHAATV